MNAIMPRFGYDLRQADLPPRWDALADSGQSGLGRTDASQSGAKFVSGYASRVLTVAVSALITLVILFFIGAGLGIW